MRGQVLSIIGVLSIVGLAACDSGATSLQRTELTAAPGPVVFRVSPDGKRLEGFGVRNGITPLGSVGLPEGAVWSVVGTGADLRVWIHGEDRVALVDARDWKVVGEWARADGGPVQAMLAQRDASAK